MIGNSLLVATAIAAGACAASKALQEPAFDFRFAVPHMTMDQQDAQGSYPTVAGTSQLGSGQDTSPFWAIPPTRSVRTREVVPDAEEAKLVSTAFHGSKADEVLTWLEQQGVNFIITDDTVKEKTITMNIVNQPLGQIVDGIASALGGHWVHHGKIRIFKAGVEGFEFGDAFGSSRAVNGVALLAPSGVYRSGTYAAPANNWSLGQGVFSFNGKTSSLLKLLDSLTSAQKSLLKSKGYLNRSDLTPSQIDTIGLTKNMHGSFSFSSNGRSVTVKF